MYGELKIDSKGRISLPRFMEFKDGDELILFTKDDYIELLSVGDAEWKLNEILMIDGIDEKERRSYVRTITSKYIYVDVNFSEKHGSRVNLTKEVISKYNFDGNLIYEIADNGRIRLWHPDKFLEYSNNLGNNTGRGK